MAKFQSIAAFLLTVLLISCEKDQPELVIKEAEPHLIADFVYHFEGECTAPVMEVILENKTENAASYSWNFGDGTSSSEVNPKKVYAKAGTYTIKLTAYFAEDTVQTEKKISIFRNSDGTGAKARISATRNPTSTTFTFEIITDEPSYLLDFGDDSTPMTSSAKIITHTFAGPGRYIATVTVRNSEGRGCASTYVILDP